jgi:hypothetical protein
VGGCHCHNSLGAWTPEGDSLIYISIPELPDSRERIVIQSVTDKGSRELFLPWRFHHKIGSTASIEDSRILLDGITPGVSGIHRFDLNRGVLDFPADLGEEGFFQNFESNSPGTKIYVIMGKDAPGIVEFNTESNSSRYVYRGRVIRASMDLSPKDDKLAFLAQEASGQPALKVLDLPSTEIRTFQFPENGSVNNPVGWFAEGDYLLIGVQLDTGKKGLWAMDANNAASPIFFDLPDAYRSYLAPNQDGKRLAYQNSEGIGELYYLTGF